MKKLMFVLVILVLLIVPSTVGAQETCKKGDTCTTIHDGTLLTSAGDPIVLSFDEWGYNYQGHVFSGGYCDSYRDAAWCQPYKDVNLLMKWNEQWLANEDCDGDGLLDRHYGFVSYIGSGAWETNQMSGEYVDEDGNTCAWNSFTKIVAAPADATLTDGIWYDADGIEIGADIWGQFAITMDVYNDTCTGDHGVLYQSPAGVGFGPWQ